jgi:hypothetical protein
MSIFEVTLYHAPTKSSIWPTPVEGFPLWYTRRNRVQINPPLWWSYPRKCINKSIWLAPGRYPWCTHRRCPPVANQIDLFMHFLGASRDGLVARRVHLDTISSSDSPELLSCTPWKNCTTLRPVRLLSIGPKIFTWSDKFRKEMHFHYQEGFLLLPRANN